MMVRSFIMVWDATKNVSFLSGCLPFNLSEKPSGLCRILTSNLWIIVKTQNTGFRIQANKSRFAHLFDGTIWSYWSLDFDDFADSAASNVIWFPAIKNQAMDPAVCNTLACFALLGLNVSVFLSIGGSVPWSHVDSEGMNQTVGYCCRSSCSNVSNELKSDAFRWTKGVFSPSVEPSWKIPQMFHGILS